MRCECSERIAIAQPRWCGGASSPGRSSRWSVGMAGKNLSQSQTRWAPQICGSLVHLGLAVRTESECSPKTGYRKVTRCTMYIRTNTCESGTSILHKHTDTPDWPNPKPDMAGVHAAGDVGSEHLYLTAVFSRSIRSASSARSQALIFPPPPPNPPRDTYAPIDSVAMRTSSDARTRR